MSASSPIGVFDSGIGGLTVVAALRRVLPAEDLVYLGDTARVPYGTKSAEVVRRYALGCSRFLVERGAKMVVIACNTASAVALDELAHELSVPVLGVIEPGAQVAAAQSKTGRIGVIGTEGTVRSRSYERALLALRPDVTVIARPAPLFVPLAEEGLTDHPATLLLAREYLAPLVAERVDTVVLGCTHYPILDRAIAQVLGSGIVRVDSANAVALRVVEALRAAGLERGGGSAGRASFFATDTGERFQRVGERFLGVKIDSVEVVDL